MQADGVVPKLKAFKTINNERGISLTKEGIARLKGPQGSCSPPRYPSTEGEVVPILVYQKEEWNPGICSKMDATRGYCGGWRSEADIKDKDHKNIRTSRCSITRLKAAENWELGKWLDSSYHQEPVAEVTTSVSGCSANPCVRPCLAT